MLGARAERLLRLGCVDVSQANLVLPLASVEDRECVAVCNLDHAPGKIPGTRRMRQKQWPSESHLDNDSHPRSMGLP